MDLGKMLGGLDGSDIGDVVKLVMDNKDAIGRLGDLPDLFEKIAGSLAAAGEQAKDAAVALVGADGKSGARAVLAQTSTALTGIHGSLGKGIDLIGQTADAAQKVPLMGGPADALSKAAGEMGSSTDLLDELSKSMSALSDVLASVGAALEKVGEHLGETSSETAKFLGK